MQMLSSRGHTARVDLPGYIYFATTNGLGFFRTAAVTVRVLLLLNMVKQKSTAWGLLSSKCWFEFLNETAVRISAGLRAQLY